MKGKPWNIDEQRAVCFAWSIMELATEQGIKFNKSAIRRELIAGPLANRSNGSIEAKLMNVSAAAVDIGLRPLKGYKPAPNYQASLRDVLKDCRDMVRVHNIENISQVA